jgi:hypothetical protein
VSLLLARQNKYNSCIVQIGSQCTMEPLLFIYDPQLEQRSRINNIEHSIPLVNKPKLAYTYIEWKQLSTWTKTVVTTKCRKCTFTALLMTPWTREHKEDSKACSYENALLIYKSGWHGHGGYEPFCGLCHIQSMFYPFQQRKWNHSIIIITKLRINFNIHVSKQFLCVHNMLQTLVISTIVFKYPH